MRSAFLSALFVVVAACGSSGGSPDGGTDDGGDGMVSCTMPQQNCGGVCVDTQNDPQNCGSCGGACAMGDQCCEGRCISTVSCLFGVTKVEPARGNQNGGDWLHLTGSGFTNDMIVLIGDGRAPVLVVDSHHATVQTPPDVVGTYDITLKSVQGTAITKNAFQYQSASVMPPWKDVAMGTVRGEYPAVAPLQDGRVLIAGGTTVPDHPENALATGAIFTRNGADGSVAPTANSMSVPRWRCSGTTMLDGRVLVVGGATCTGTACKSADIFDPMTNTFTPSKGTMSEDRTSTWAVLMVDGRVMITSSASTTAEIYDPKTDSFSTIPLAVTHQFAQRIVRLRDGRILVIGGDGCVGMTCGPAQTAVDVWDPGTGMFASGAPMKQGRSQFTAHVLPDGRAMVIGGASISAGGVHVPLDQIETYDPKAGVWTVATYKLSTGRAWHASALVRDGTVLVMGGYNVDSMCTPTNTVDVVDPVKGMVAPFATLQNPNTEWNAVTMLDGSVVAVGGGACMTSMALPDIYFLPGGPAPN